MQKLCKQTACNGPSSTVSVLCVSFQVEDKNSISPLVAGLRKEVQALITEVRVCTVGFNDIGILVRYHCRASIYFQI